MDAEKPADDDDPMDDKPEEPEELLGRRREAKWINEYRAHRRRDKLYDDQLERRDKLYDDQLERQDKANEESRVSYARSHRAELAKEEAKKKETKEDRELNDAKVTEYDAWYFRRILLQKASESLEVALRTARHNHTMALEDLRLHDKREPKHTVGDQLVYKPSWYDVAKLRKEDLWGAGPDYGNNQPQPVRNSSSGSSDHV